MKVCNQCSIEKNESEFRQWRAVCRKCENISGREYHKENSERINSNKVNKNRERYQAKRRYLVEYLQKNPCVDCGETRVACLEFDHVRGEKLDKISSIINRGWKQLLTELEKCDVRCANCHAIVTAQRAGHWWANL